MTLEEAIAAFEKQRKGVFSKEDRARVMATAAELGLVQFELNEVPSKKYPQFIRDVEDVLHVHRTMLVARRSFSGSTDRGVDPYPAYPHHLSLTEWIMEKDVSGRAVCPSCHIVIPLVGRCEYCEWSPIDAD